MLHQPFFFWSSQCGHPQMFLFYTAQLPGIQRHPFHSHNLGWPVCRQLLPFPTVWWEFPSGSVTQAWNLPTVAPAWWNCIRWANSKPSPLFRSDINTFRFDLQAYFKFFLWWEFLWEFPSLELLWDELTEFFKSWQRQQWEEIWEVVGPAAALGISPGFYTDNFKIDLLP